MIIPIRCFTCGCLIANKYEFYRRKLEEAGSDGSPVYYDGSSVPKTIEAKIMEELGIRRLCCKKTVLTSVDLTEEL